MSLSLTGFGYDIHQLEEGRPLVLGGVQIPNSPHGPIAHSDGDVLLHALCDALLGAAGLRDIGHYFPNTDHRFENISSLELLRQVRELIEGEGGKVVQVDCTLVLEQPKLAPYRDEICRTIASHLDIPERRVSVKATTNEGIGSIGRGEGMAAYAVAVISIG
ncbi:MAG: 2-C-methyl-D-erythritol 2,4-cyclodiphosphate synthase [Ignavibacteriae bacterium]|nr:2-C-methyl-D-erythritol 2,4-cyclodiphosphate synthase [Ignavibacteriota bacterium]